MEEVVEKDIPRVLVQTWISLVRNEESSDEVRTRALTMLKGALGSSEKWIPNLAQALK